MLRTCSEQIIGRYSTATQSSAADHATPAALNDQQRIIEQEQQVFAARHQEFLAMYPGETIAIHAGKVIDHDVDRVALSRRFRGRYGNQPIYDAGVAGTDPDNADALTTPDGRIVLIQPYSTATFPPIPVLDIA